MSFFAEEKTLFFPHLERHSKPKKLAGFQVTISGWF